MSQGKWRFEHFEAPITEGPLSVDEEDLYRIATMGTAVYGVDEKGKPIQVGFAHDETAPFVLADKILEMCWTDWRAWMLFGRGPWVEQEVWGSRYGTWWHSNKEGLTNYTVELWHKRALARPNARLCRAVAGVLLSRAWNRSWPCSLRLYPVRLTTPMELDQVMGRLSRAVQLPQHLLLGQSVMNPPPPAPEPLTIGQRIAQAVGLMSSPSRAMMHQGEAMLRGINAGLEGSHPAIEARMVEFQERMREMQASAQERGRLVIDSLREGVPPTPEPNSRARRRRRSRR